VSGLLRTLVETYNELGIWARVGIVVAIALGTTAAGFTAIVLLPADHFLPRPARDTWWRRHRLVHWTFLLVKNVLGVIILALGVVMLVAPGPGLVFMLLGLSLLDFPGKRSIERKLVGRPSVMRFLNELRASFKKPPFAIEPE
jgi:hypothetical protein